MRYLVALTFARTLKTRPVVVRGENDATEIRVDCTPALKLWPDATFTLLFKRPGGEAYIAAEGLTADEKNNITYLLTDVETAIPGTLSMEVQARQSGVLAKSFLYYFKIEPGIDPTGEPPEPTPDWIDEVLDAAESAKGAAQDAQGASEDAAKSAEDAAKAAASVDDTLAPWKNAEATVEMIAPDEPADMDVAVGADKVMFGLRLPRQRVAYPVFEVDENMDLIMTVPDGYDGANFKLTNGELEVVV
ncbi:hypothetical protein LJC74_01660 [Eubacteriales bacterium OttesenSCG-928-A19]|nr:hypothetical protein [Eubacteriales bacterium OttesenSCG-928-A19]